MPPRDLKSTKELMLRSFLDRTIGDEKVPDDRIVEPALSPIDFIPIPGSGVAKLGGAVGREAEQIAAKSGAFRRLKGLFQPSPYKNAAPDEIGRLINPELHNMQKTGVVSDALKQKSNDLQNQIKDLAHVNDFDYNRLQELKQANNFIPMNVAPAGSTETTKILNPKEEALRRLANGF